MEYSETDFSAQQKANVFRQALDRKVGHPVETGDISTVMKALKKELLDEMIKNQQRIDEGVYGWAIFPPHGRAGQVRMLTKDDLA